MRRIGLPIGEKRIGEERRGKEREREGKGGEVWRGGGGGGGQRVIFMSSLSRNKYHCFDCMTTADMIIDYFSYRYHHQ